MRHTISCLVRNQPGVLARLANFFATRAVNIHSLAVNESEVEDASRITIVVEGEREQLFALADQVMKLEAVVKVEDLDRSGFLDRELVLIKVSCEPEDLPRLMQVCEVMRANVVAMTHETMTLEMTGRETKVSAFINLLKPFGILECARSGRVAVSAGELL
jgi:acetolactate synthase I/III small subunit